MFYKRQINLKLLYDLGGLYLIALGNCTNQLIPAELPGGLCILEGEIEGGMHSIFVSDRAERHNLKSRL